MPDDNFYRNTTDIRDLVTIITNKMSMFVFCNKNFSLILRSIFTLTLSHGAPESTSI